MTPDSRRSTTDRPDRHAEIHEDPHDREPLIFELPISFLDRQRVETLLLDSDDNAQTERTRFNALATLAIAQYCKYIGLVPDFDRSQLWSTRDFSRADLEDVADLPLDNGRTLECRPYRTGESIVFVPRSVWPDRDGFLAVGISEDLRRATISGFLRTIDRESIPLDRWADLNLFLDTLLATPQEDASPEPPSALSPEAPSASSPNAVPPLPAKPDPKPDPSTARRVNQLDDWFSDVMESGWLTLAELKARLGFQAPELSFRGGALQENASGYATRTLARAKLLEFPAAPVRESAAASPTASHTDDRPLQIGFSVRTTTLDTGIREVSCQIVPAADCDALPTALTLSLLDEAGDVLNRANPKGSDSFGFRLTLERGERFSVRIALAETEYTEHFVG